MSFTHDEYVQAILALSFQFTAAQYLRAILGLEAEFAFSTRDASLGALV